MPKLKTNKSVRKRFRITKKKKVLYAQSKRRHLLTDKSSEKKRGLRRMSTAKSTDKRKIITLLPYA